MRRQLVVIYLGCFGAFGFVSPPRLRKTEKGHKGHSNLACSKGPKQSGDENGDEKVPNFNITKFDPIVSIAGFMGYEPNQKWRGFQAFVLSVLIGWCIIDIYNQYIHIGYIYDFFENRELFP